MTNETPSAADTPVQANPGPAAAPAPAGKIHLSFLGLMRNLISIMGLVGMAFSGLLLLFLVALEIAGVFKE